MENMFVSELYSELDDDDLKQAITDKVSQINHKYSSAGYAEFLLSIGYVGSGPEQTRAKYDEFVVSTYDLMRYTHRTEGMSGIFANRYVMDELKDITKDHEAYIDRRISEISAEIHKRWDADFNRRS